MIHTAERCYVCEVCLKTFNKASHLTKHRQTHRNKDDVPSVSDESGQQTNAASSADIIIVHDGENIDDVDNVRLLVTHSYTVAVETFSNAVDNIRVQQMDVDTETQNMQDEIFSVSSLTRRCHVCHKGFLQSSQLKRYVLTDTDEEEPYICVACKKGYAYAQVTGLEVQKTVKTGDKGHNVCDVDAKALNEASRFTQDKQTPANKDDVPSVSDECRQQTNTLSRAVVSNIHGGENIDNVENMLCSPLSSHSYDVGETRNNATDMARVQQLYDVTEAQNTQKQVFSKSKRTSASKKTFTDDTNDNNDDVSWSPSNSCDVDSEISSKAGESNERPYVCDVCRKRYKQLSHLNRHEMSHGKKKPFNCEICQKGFVRQSHLEVHLRSHTGQRPYVCEVCGKAFKKDDHLARHRQTHTSDKPKPYTCDICQKRFNDKYRLKQHERVHSSECPFVCDICTKAFRTLGVFREHQRIHTHEKRYSCSICQKRFSQSGYLKEHKRVHSGEKPYVCHVCSKAFNSSSCFIKHKRMHENPKPFVCDMCQVGFARAYNLKQHKYAHTGERPYLCEVCPKAFRDNRQLTVHKLTHSNQKNYICDVCQKGFTQPSDLRLHSCVHSNRKPYICSNDKPYVCQVCLKAYSSSSNLARHKRNHQS